MLVDRADQAKRLALLFKEFQAAFNAVFAFPLPATSTDSALLVTLPPGSYTAQVNGASGSTGIALLEVYEMP